MKRLIKSVGFALNGINTCFKQEPNFKIHVTCTFLVVVAGIYFKISHMEWISIIVCIAAVLSAELINTAIEHLCNIIHAGHSPAIKIVKDVSAAAVLVFAIASMVCAAIIFIPKIILLINQQ